MKLKTSYALVLPFLCGAPLAAQTQQELGEAVVSASGVGRVNQSAYNAVAVSTEGLKNSTKNLSDALAKVSGLKLREAGGVGSDLTLSLDGFTGKHVKVFIDGVPQEGVGEAFGLNNITVVTTDGELPTVYAIDPATARATPGLTVEADEIGAVEKLNRK